MTGTGDILRDIAVQVVQSVGRAVVGGLCGVGLVWTLGAMWPASKPYIQALGNQIERLSGSYPTVAVGLIGGVMVTLLCHSVRRR